MSVGCLEHLSSMLRNILKNSAGPNLEQSPPFLAPGDHDNAWRPSTSTASLPADIKERLPFVLTVSAQQDLT